VKWDVVMLLWHWLPPRDEALNRAREYEDDGSSDQSSIFAFGMRIQLLSGH
jgi:hypothetical protein